MRTAVFAALFVLFLMSCASNASVSSPIGERPDDPAEGRSPSEVPGAALLLSVWNEIQHRREIYPFDAETGAPLPGYATIQLPANVPFNTPHVFSPAGDTLALVNGPNQSCEGYQGGQICRLRAETLHLIDLRNWEERPVPIDLNGWASALAFSPDGQRLALGLNLRDRSWLVLFDAVAGSVVAKHELPFRPTLLGFAADSAELVAFGTPVGKRPGLSRPEPPRLLLLESPILELRWEVIFDDLLSGGWCLENCSEAHERQLFTSWRPGVALSPAGQKRYIVHPDEDRLTIVDLEAKTVSSLPIQPARSWLERLLSFGVGSARAKAGVNGAFRQALISPDGVFLYVSGRAFHSTLDKQGPWQVEETSLGIQVIEAASGRQMIHRG